MDRVLSSSKLQVFIVALALSWISAVNAKLIEEEFVVSTQIKNAYGKSIEQGVYTTLMVDDQTPSPRPLLVINHGRAYKPELRATVNPKKSYAANARWFARLGFAVVMPTRIGYGMTGGEDVEDTGPCNRKNYQPSYDAAAAQVIQVVQAVRKKEGILRDRGVIMGQSLGGATSIAVSAQGFAGIQAYINFAGGGGGNPETHSQNPCGVAQLERMFANYGKTAHQPTLWIYTENDQWMGSIYPKQWFDAYVGAGGKGQFVLYPPHGADGHGIFTSSPKTWQPTVLSFLQTNGFAVVAASVETQLSKEEPNLLNLEFRANYRGTNFADISNVEALPLASATCKKRYEDWLKRPAPKGFALSERGQCVYTWGTTPPSADLPTDPAERALIACRRVSEDQKCKLYAIDGDVVWQP